MPSTSTFGDDIPLDSHIIEVRIHNLRNLFDALDPSPFIAQDLDETAQQYIVGSANEVSSRLPLALAIYLVEPPSSEEEGRDVGEAIREHFARQSGFAGLRFNELIRRGGMSLIIGLAFLSLALTLSSALLRWAPLSNAVEVFREGLLICGWVAMWRPLEIFLYDWWPILGESKTFDRLSHMPVQVVVAGPAPIAKP